MAGAGEVHEPGDLALDQPDAAPAARWPVHVGQPTWSVTTCTASRSPASLSIVSAKLRPPVPNSHALRTTAWRGRGVEHLTLAGELALAVDRTGAGGIGLHVWARCA